MYRFDQSISCDRPVIDDFGLGESILKRIRKAAKKTVKPITRVTEKILKPIVTPLRPVGAAAAAMTPLGLFVQPKVLGVKSETGQRIFDTTQKIGRIVVGTAAVIVTGGAAASALAPAAAGGGGGVLSGLGILKTMGIAGLTKVKDFFVASGVAPDVAAGLAQDVLAGRRPVPSELDMQLQQTQTEQGGPMLPLLLLAGVGVAGFFYLRQKG